MSPLLIIPFSVGKVSSDIEGSADVELPMCLRVDASTVEDTLGKVFQQYKSNLG